MLSIWLIAFNLERLWVDGNLSFFRGKRGTDLALVVVMLPALEQLVPDAIARLEHACSLAGQLDPRLLDSRELRLFVDAVVPLSERPRLLLRKIEEPTPAAGGWCSPSSPRFSSFTI